MYKKTRKRQISRGRGPEDEKPHRRQPTRGVYKKDEQEVIRGGTRDCSLLPSYWDVNVVSSMQIHQPFTDLDLSSLVSHKLEIIVPWDPPRPIHWRTMAAVYARQISNMSYSSV